MLKLARLLNKALLAVIFSFALYSGLASHAASLCNPTVEATAELEQPAATENNQGLLDKAVVVLGFETCPAVA